METLPRSAAHNISALPFEGMLPIQFAQAENFAGDIDLGELPSGMVQFLSRFADTMATFKGIATKELTQQPSSEDENRFQRSLGELDTTYAGTILWTFWYAGAFYRSNEGQAPRLIQSGQSGGQFYDSRPVHDVDLEDIIVADVHTDYPSQFSGDRGCVLHEGLHRHYIPLIAVDSGRDRMTYAGPVFGRFEFITPFGVRFSAAEWKARLDAGDRPQHPEWT